MKQQTHRQQMYAGIARLKGKGSSFVTSASKKINQLLYGEKGAWRTTR